MKPVTDVYRYLADNWERLPPDKMLCYLLGCSLGAVTGARTKLRESGYQITSDGVGGWDVTERPDPQLWRDLARQELDRLRRRIEEIERDMETQHGND